MKNVKFNLKYVLILMVSMALFSCSKGDTGDTGPIGPQGPQGEQGIQGPAGQDGEALGVPGPQGDQGPAGQDGTDGVDGADGADGQDGADGNANVFVSDWTPTEFSTTASSFSFFEIVTANLNTNGVVLVFGRLVSDPGSDFIVPFPFESSNERYSYLIDPSQGTFPNIQFADIRFTAQTTDGSNKIFTRISEVRYVNIPPQSSGKSSIDFNKMTYEEVMDHFALDY